MRTTKGINIDTDVIWFVVWIVALFLLYTIVLPMFGLVPAAMNCDANPSSMFCP